MVKAKNTLKNKTKTQTKKRASTQRPRTQARTRKQNLRLGTTQKVIIAVIALAFIGVSIAALVAFFAMTSFRWKPRSMILLRLITKIIIIPMPFLAILT